LKESQKIQAALKLKYYFIDMVDGRYRRPC